MNTQMQLNQIYHRRPGFRSGLAATLLAIAALGTAPPAAIANGQICPADLNADGVVDATDLGILLNNFGCIGVDCPANLNGDNAVDATDLGILLNNFGCIGKVIPPHNRGIEAIQFSPGSAPGLWNATAIWYVETNETDEFRDLSALVVASVNGVQVNTSLEVATINAASGACLGSTPPCNGLDCGTWTIGPLTLNGTCVKSIASLIGIDFCTCACVVITLSVEDFPLNDGDLVTVQLLPAPGALPEIITGDDSIDVVFNATGKTGACCLEPFGSGCIDNVTAETCAASPDAQFFPGATCADLGCGPAVSPCCTLQIGPGCGDPACEAIVCGVNPFCCDVLWDALCADLANELCPVCAPDQAFLFEFEYNGLPQPIVPNTSDLPFPDYAFTLFDDQLPGPVTIIPVDPFGIPLPGNESGVQLQPGGSLAIREPEAAGYLLVPAKIPGAIGIVEVKNFQNQTTNTVKRVCNEISDTITIQSTNPPGAEQVTVSGSFSVPANTEEEFFCPIRVTIVVQQFDEENESWVESAEAEQPESPVVIAAGTAQDIEVTILGGRRVVYSTRCLAPSGDKCQFNYTKANN